MSKFGFFILLFCVYLIEIKRYNVLFFYDLVLIVKIWNIIKFLGWIKELLRFKMLIDEIRDFCVRYFEYYWYLGKYLDRYLWIFVFVSILKC